MAPTEPTPFDTLPDGKLVGPVNDSRVDLLKRPLVVVLNWPTELATKVPAK